MATGDLKKEWTWPEARILLFAKTPVPGRVCTRLEGQLGREGAVAIYRRLLCFRLRQLKEASQAPVEVWVDGCLDHPVFEPWRVDFDWFLQRGEDLGERMWQAVREAAGRSRWQLLIGVDSPALDAACLRAALTELQAGRQAVLGPAEDGGYVLLALAEAERSRELFINMPWGTDRVAAITRSRLNALGWGGCELPVLWDLDRPEDLPRLAAFDRSLVPDLS